MSCLIKKFREKVESGINRRKGQPVGPLETPEGMPEDVWAKTHRDGVILEDVYVVYKHKTDPENVWEVSLQAVALKDGYIGLRVVHFKRGRPVGIPMITYSWVLVQGTTSMCV
nr:hypothetical protein [Candidatus Baldrarchaeota archaeon]